MPDMVLHARKKLSRLFFTLPCARKIETRCLGSLSNVLDLGGNFDKRVTGMCYLTSEIAP